MPPTAADRPRTAAPGVSLLPREHGAYALMAFPQATALILGGITLPAILLAAAVVCAFLVHEPVLVVLGRRGPRAARAAGRRARIQAAGLLVLGAGCGAGGLLLSAAPLWDAALVAGVLAVLAVVFIAGGAEKSIGGEAAVALVFAAAGVPTAVAAGVAAGRAWAAAAAWAAVFVLATVTVKVVIDRHKRRRRWPSALLIAGVLGMVAAVLGILSGTWVGSWLHAGAAAAVLPAVVTVLAVVISGMTPRRLRWLGWSLMASNTATLVILALSLR
jgi:hypothetical protein